MRLRAKYAGVLQEAAACYAKDLRLAMCERRLRSYCRAGQSSEVRRALFGHLAEVESGRFAREG